MNCLVSIVMYRNILLRAKQRAHIFVAFWHCVQFTNALQVAESYKNEERIFYPHNLDFRGRAYTLHGHLTHLGSDICRGILQFADSRPLGEEGLDWLFVQVRCLLSPCCSKRYSIEQALYRTHGRYSMVANRMNTAAFERKKRGR